MSKEKNTVFAKVGHAMNKNGDGEKYKEVEVAQTLNTFQNNSEGRAIELICAEILENTITISKKPKEFNQ